MSEIKITKDNFEEILNQDKKVLIDFWASWCGPCQMISPIISEIAEESNGEYIVGKVNVDEEGELASAFNVTSIPYLVVLKDKKVLKSALGYMPKEKVLELLD